MLISRDHLRVYARNLLSILDREGIDNLSDLERNLDKRFEVEEDSTHFVLIELRPSNLGTEAFTLSYIVPIIGIPVEAKLNKILEYSQIFIKLSEELSGYDIFAQDPYGNLIQNKVIHSIDVSQIRKELENLVV